MNYFEEPKDYFKNHFNIFSDESIVSENFSKINLINDQTY